MTILFDAIMRATGRHARSIAIDDGRRQLRYADLRGVIAMIAARIEQLVGDRPGSVAVELDNGVDWVIADLALLKLGRAAVPLPPFFTAAQRANALADAGAIAIVAATGIERLDNLAVPLPAGTAKISYTSGSTGSPKGICLDQPLMLATAEAIVNRLGEGMAGVHLPLLPLGVLLENVAGLYATLLAGGCYAVRPMAELGFANAFSLDGAALCAAIADIGATSLILVPELLARIVATLEAGDVRLPALRLVAVGGARVPVALLERAATLGLPVVQGYGLTECGSVVSLEAIGEIARGSVGRPLNHARITLAKNGEIIIDGHFHLGTVGAPRATGPIRTGDIGAIDEQGRLSIVGRKSNLIINGFGRNIAPEWVEEALVAQPQIAQAMVYGDGDATLSALIVPSSMTADIAAGVAAANANLPDYARVAAWQMSRPFLPVDGTLTANGRMRRDAIVARVAAMPFFDRLVSATAPARGRMLTVPQLTAGLRGEISRNTYLAYLAQAYHHVRHTVPLMRIARERLAHKPALVAALDDYIAEEEGHEKWILNDIRAAGGDPDRAVADGPSPATAAMVDHAYATVRHGNPAAFFGMVFVLEGTSIALASNGAEAVQSSLGLPPSAFTYLTSHGALDQDHMLFFEELVNRLDDRGDEAAILTMANEIFDLFGDVFAAIPMENAREAA